MNLGPAQIFVIAFLVLVLFGRGRISEMMGDFGKGVKSFRQGVSEDIGPPENAMGRLEREGLNSDETLQCNIPKDRLS